MQRSRVPRAASLAGLLVAVVLGLTTACSTGAPPPPPVPTTQEPPPAPAPPPGPPEVPGLAVWASTVDAAETTDRVEAALEQAGGPVVTVDHAENAATVGQALPPTVLILGGPPALSVPIIDDAPAAGVDLPARFLVWQDGGGSVWLGYDTAAYLGARAGLPADAASLDDLAEAQEDLARSATGAADPVVSGDDVDGVSPAGYLVTRTSPRSPASAIDALGRAVAADGVVPAAIVAAGDPEAVTPLIQAAQTSGIDLPSRFLAVSPDGTTRLAHPDVRGVAARHGITGQDEELAALAQDEARWAAEAAG